MKRRPLRIKTERIPPEDTLSWLLGWRWAWEVYDWYDDGERWIFAEENAEPLHAGWYSSTQSYEFTLSGRRSGRARSREKAVKAAESHIAWLRKQQARADEHEALRRSSVEYH